MRIPALLALLLAAALPAVEFPLSGTTIAGESLAIDPAKRQRPVVLVFWASWCDTCMREVPSLIRFHAAAGERVDLVSCSIDTDAEAAKRCAAKRQMTYPVILDGGMAIADRFAVDATPTLVLIDTTGHEVARGRSLGQLADGLAKLGIAQP